MLRQEDVLSIVGQLPTWYVQILADREPDPICAPCLANWIEVELTDFEGAAWGQDIFVMISALNTNSSLAPEHTMLPPSGKSGRIPLPVMQSKIPLVGSTGSTLDLGIGISHTQKNINTDERLGDSVEELVYLMDSPAQYDGPLVISGSAEAIDTAGFAYFSDVINSGLHRSSGIGQEAALEMLAEIDQAMRAALGVYEDLSLTARNAAEAELILAYQARSPMAHLSPTAEPVGPDGDPNMVENTFQAALSGDAPAFFVGPDGAVYSDADGMLGGGLRVAPNPMLNAAGTLSAIDQTMARVEQDIALNHRPRWQKWFDRMYDGARDGFAQARAALAYAVALATALPGEAIAVFSRAGVPSPHSVGRGARRSAQATKSNQRGKPPSRNGPLAHSQLSAKRPVKSMTTIKFRGITLMIPKSFLRHMDPGDGAKGRSISGAHTPTAFKAAVTAAGGEYKRIDTHPANANIKRYMYRLPRADGTMRPWNMNNTKTTYNLPQAEFLAMTREALKNAAIRQKGKFPQNAWVGNAKNGYKLQGWLKPLGNNKFELKTAFFDWEL